MVTDRSEDLKSIMHDNATFIVFPLLGSSTSMISVYGDHRVNIQRTIRSIMQLVGSIRFCGDKQLTRSFARLVNFTLVLFGFFPCNSMHCYLLPPLILPKSRLLSNKYRLQRVLRWFSRACALSFMGSNMKSVQALE